MQLHIIHLPHRIDRWQSLQAELQKQNISDYKIWDGIIGERPCAGIARAHKQIVQYAKENDIPEVLIGEDDLSFTAENSFEYFLNKKPVNFDLYLSSIYQGKIKDDIVTNFAGLTFYIVRQKFYNTFLSAREDINLDRALSNLGKYVVCKPFTVIQQNGYSDNVKFYRYNYNLLESKNCLVNNSK